MKRHNSFSDKWSPDVAATGFTQIPNILIEKQAELGISSTEMQLIIGLMKHGWYDNVSSPSLKTLGAYCGKSRNRMQDVAKSLADKGLIKRTFRGGNLTNEYDITPLAKRLNSFAQATEKSVGSHRKVSSSTYRNINTKEYSSNKIYNRGFRSRSGKLEKLSIIAKSLHGP